MKNKVLKLFDAYFKHYKIEDSFFNKEFLVLLKEQALLPYLFYVSESKKGRNFYYASMMHQETLNSLQEQLTDLFNKNDINHLYVKGSIINKIYDDNALRTRGDIDVYLDIKDLEKAKNILINEGFTYEKETCMHHIEMEKDNLIVELHFSLFDIDEKEYNRFFKNPFNMATLVNKNYYTLNNEEHFIYCLCHFARHLRLGAGIRYIIDFYYMLKKLDLNFDKLHAYLSDLKLDTLYNNVLNAIYLITGEEYDNLHKIDIDFFIEYLLQNGVHGLSHQETYDERQYGERRNKFSHMLSVIFMNDKTYRISLYPKYGKKTLMYPILLIHHIFYLFTHKFKKLLKFLFVRKSKKDKEKKDFEKRLGI